MSSMFQYKCTIFRENTMPIFKNQLPLQSCNDLCWRIQVLIHLILMCTVVTAENWQLVFKTWPYVLPEDGTFVPKLDGDAHVMFVWIKTVLLVNIVNGVHWLLWPLWLLLLPCLPQLRRLPLIFRLLHLLQLQAVIACCGYTYVTEVFHFTHILCLTYISAFGCCIHFIQFKMELTEGGLCYSGIVLCVTAYNY